jgi:hypothetical protein
MIRPKARKLALLGVRRKSPEKIGVGVNHTDTDSITVRCTEMEAWRALKFFYLLAELWTRKYFFRILIHGSVILNEGTRSGRTIDYGSMCTDVYGTHWPIPAPPPPHLGSYTRPLLVNQDRRHLFKDPSLS